LLKDATFKSTLELILLTNKLSRKVVSENTIVIYPATPQKAKQYDEMHIKVFYLTNIDAKNTVNLLRTMIKAKDIFVHADLNAVVIRARPDAIELARKILDAADLADAEILLDVDIIEINRTKSRNLGVDLPDSLTVTVPQDTTVGGVTGITLGDLDTLSSEDLLITLPSGVLNFGLEELDAELLANPRIRVKNNEKAKIHIGDKVPIITTTVLSGGQTQENVQYLDVGLKLNVEPTIRPNDEIDLKIGLEVSSLGTKTTTNSGSVFFQIGTRNTDTTLRLSDGETQIIGGLITEEERSTVVKVPGFGEIPIIGRLFANEDTSVEIKDILMSITPHIIRRVEVPDESRRSIPSGRQDSPSIKPVLEGFQPPADSAEAGVPAGEIEPEEGEVSLPPPTILPVLPEGTPSPPAQPEAVPSRP
jgi:general secretion pathway protein D